MRLIEIADLVNGVGDRDASSQEDRCLFGALDLADAALGQPGGPARSGTAPSGVTTPAVGLATRCPRAGREQARRCARACRRTSPRSRDRQNPADPFSQKDRLEAPGRTVTVSRNLPAGRWA